MGQMDFSCPKTVRNEICLKCRDTIPLVEVCFRFELFLKVLKLESNLESTIEFLSKFQFFFSLLSPQDDAEIILKLPDYSNCFYITSLIQTTPEYTTLENFAKIGRVVSEHER